MQGERRQDVYYELYIDVFFLVNFMMDAILLEILRKILGCPVSHGRVLLGFIAIVWIGINTFTTNGRQQWTQRDIQPQAQPSNIAVVIVMHPVAADGQTARPVVYDALRRRSPARQARDRAF